ncbi:MAG: 16S rRNA (cytosine(967)-C(5))-methyltransferase RsmB [Myxococcaceae bacterium]
MKPRAQAIQILSRVAATDAYLNVVVDTMLSEAPPSDVRDARLVTELCYGSMRRQLTLDFVLAQLSSQKLEQLEDRVLAALRVGAYQCFFTRVPRRAAVAETVEAMKELKLARATGYVNAVLRKVAALETLPLPPPEPLAPHLAVRESHPEWLVERWLRQFGPDKAQAMLAADNEPPSVVVRVNRAKTDRETLLKQWTEAGLHAEPTGISDVGIRLHTPGRVEDLLGYDEGLWQVQDEAAQLVGLFSNLREGSRVLDACAAPGGKACHLAESHQVVAADLHANKLRKIEAEAKRLGLSDKVKVLAHDATEPFPEELGEFDAVVVDAPCGGLGTLRRHPELRYRRKEEDLSRLAGLQRRILESCQERVAPGGLLIYAVCSVDVQEGPDQVELFLRSHPDFTTETPKTALPFPLWQGHLRTLPGPEGLDGFFAARLRKLC